jgi:hypothetical protein
VALLSKYIQSLITYYQISDELRSQKSTHPTLPTPTPPRRGAGGEVRIYQ